MLSKQRLIKGSKLIAPLVLVLCAMLFWPEEYLVAESGGKQLFAMPIRKGDTFVVGFTHSLNLSPVEDVIEWTESGMILRKSVFKTFGAGIPVPSDGIGSELVHTDGKYELLGINKPLTSFTVMTQQIPDHYIIFNGQEIRLLKLVGSGKQVVITVKRLPRLMSLQ